MRKRYNLVFLSYFSLFFILIFVALLNNYILSTVDVDRLTCSNGKIISAEKKPALGGYVYTISYDNELVTKNIRGVYNSPEYIGKDVKVYVSSSGRVITDLELNSERDSNNVILVYTCMCVVLFIILVRYMKEG